MRQHVDDRAELLDAFGRAGRVAHDGLAPDAGHPAGEAAERATRRIASASPGASRSITARVPSGVWSRGAEPVPPVVTTSPAKPSVISINAVATRT